MRRPCIVALAVTVTLLSCFLSASGAEDPIKAFAKSWKNADVILKVPILALTAQRFDQTHVYSLTFPVTYVNREQGVVYRYTGAYYRDPGPYRKHIDTDPKRFLDSAVGCCGAVTTEALIRPAPPLGVRPSMVVSTPAIVTVDSRMKLGSYVLAQTVARVSDVEVSKNTIEFQLDYKEGRRTLRCWFTVEAESVFMGDVESRDAVEKLIALVLTRKTER